MWEALVQENMENGHVSAKLKYMLLMRSNETKTNGIPRKAANKPLYLSEVQSSIIMKLVFNIKQITE